MQTFESTFKRKEVKYRLTADQYVRIRAALAGYMVPDKYGATAIISTYLDTPERYLIIQSQEKPLYKEKLRIRRYGDALDATTPTFVEIKKKYKGIVYKRRICMSAAASRAFLRG
ncbi:MAG: VTC domain-containing protein, partial [Eggerthellaceae bacterium]|nr:VTC domain-containing protein [Eggerthellaceae bacterium]